MISSIHSSLFGLQQARGRLDRSADRIARAGLGTEADSVELASEMVNTVLARHEFSANAATMRASDEMLGTIIDLLA